MRLATLALLAALASGAAARDFEEFGGRCDGVSDDGPAWNAAMAAIARPAHDRVLHMPAGGCMFYNPPAPLPESASILGQGINATVLRRAYSTGLFVVLQGQGSRVWDLSLVAEPGTYQGTGLYGASTDALAGGAWSIRNVMVTGAGASDGLPAGTWSASVHFDGSQRTLPPLGVRVPSVENLLVFNATWYLFTCWNCVGLDWRGGGAFQGSGTSKGIVIGGQDAAVNHVDAIIDWGASTVWTGSVREP